MKRVVTMQLRQSCVLLRTSIHDPPLQPPQAYVAAGPKQETVLGGSWVLVSRVLSRVTTVPMYKCHEPSRRGSKVQTLTARGVENATGLE